MRLLLYKSNEIFSSTELIRKSKKIFNKIIDQEIEKAIIMRDGKPGFLLMDFEKYEEIMTEFEELKAKSIGINSVENKAKEKKNNSKQDIEDMVDLKEEIETTKTKIAQITDKPKEKIQPSRVVPPRPIKEEIVFEKKDNDIKTDIIEQKVPRKEIAEEELSEEEEIKKALDSIKSMNFDDTMKATAEKKIKERILKARKDRAEQKKKEEIENKDDLKEELEIQVHIKEENKKKERELKEFWD